jgi:aspartyl-tRNA(Asn)/glutamyl-tRNA(Gln) amidotransferase subunit A
MTEQIWVPLAELSAMVNESKVSAVDLVNKSLTLIQKNIKYNAVIATLDETALNRAKMVDREIKQGKNKRRLAGVPFIAKDNFLVLGADTTAASNILKGFRPPYQATAINLLEREGAICVAKANMDAFAHGGSTENSDFFITKNPYDISRVPGGSSGGSAASVALSLVPFALGTDTGGSIRQPASFCGVYGYKPTYGLVSRSGVIAMGSSLDCIGPLSTRVEDSALVLDIISGKDELDATTINKDSGGYITKASQLTGQRIGIINQYMDEGVSIDVRRGVNSIVEKLKQAGAIIQNINLPSISLALACYYIICPAEVSSNLSRYDGQRYGYSDSEANDLFTSYVNSRGKGFGKEAKRRIMIGTHVLSSGYYDAYYKKAQTVRTKLINEFNKAFNEVDFLIGPVTPTTAFKIGEHSKNPLEMYLSDVMTVGANLAGIPAASLPIGAGQEDGLPIGLQLMSPQKKDRDLLALSLAIERLV